MGHERILVRYRTPAGEIHQELELTRHEIIDELVEERRRHLEEEMDAELDALREALEGKAIDDLAKTWEEACDMEGDIPATTWGSRVEAEAAVSAGSRA